MNEIRRVLREAERRLLLSGLLSTLVWALAAGLGVLALVVIVDRAFAIAPRWGVIAGVVGGGALALGLVWAAARRVRGHAVARIVDERAGLRESLSTALCVERETDAWSRAVVESAVERARRVVVRDAIPIRSPRHWPAPVITGAALLLAWFLMPPLDLRGALARKQEAEEAQRELNEARADVAQAEQKIREMMARAGVEWSEDKPNEALDADLAKPKSAEDLRKDAIRKLTDAGEKLREKAEGEDAQKLDSLRDMMRQLRSPGEGPMTELSRQLARGNFEQARKELDEIKKQLESGDLDAKEREALASQLQNIGEQMEKLASQKSDLEQALKNAGVDPAQARQAAASPEAVRKLIEQAQNLSPEQKQQLQQLAQSMEQASRQCQGMGQSMRQMAQSMQGNAQGQQSSEAMDDLSSQLSQAEMMQMDMEAVQASMEMAAQQMASLGECMGGEAWSQCQGQGNKPGPTGQWRPGASQSSGTGSGGPGKGNGEGPDSQSADFMYRREKANVANTGGPIIGSRFVFGEQVKGEATEAFAEVVQAASAEAAEAITTMNVEPQFRESVKHYFGRLEERVRAERGAAPPPAEPEAQDPPPGPDD